MQCTFHRPLQLVLLAMRAYDLSRGEGGTVLVDGVDTRQWHVQSLRKRMGLVQQEVNSYAT